MVNEQSWTMVFDALRDERRRQVMGWLLTGEQGIDVSELVDDAADERARRAALYHKHLPKLASAGLVDWDQTAETVETGPAFEEVRPLLQALDDDGGLGRREE